MAKTLEQHRVRLPAEYAERRYLDGLAGTAAANVTKRQTTAERDAEIRARAAKMDGDLRDASKAEILTKHYPALSARQLRRIISTRKKLATR